MGLRLCIKDTFRLTNLPLTDKNVLKVKLRWLEDLFTYNAIIIRMFIMFFFVIARSFVVKISMILLNEKYL